MHAFLLVGQENCDFEIQISKLATINKAKVLPFVLQKIEDARELKKLIKFSFAQKTAIVIKDIDTATVETTNAFLKNLEEPNENLIYILTATNINNVIPTIISRCQVIKIIHNAQPAKNNKALEFLKEKLNKKFEIIAKIKDREEAIKFVEDLLFVDDDFNNKENYLKTLKNLKLNGNVSLQLTNLLAKMNSHG